MPIKQNVVLYHEILTSNQPPPSDYGYTDNIVEPQKRHAKWRKTDTKDYILHDPVYMKFLKMANLQRQRSRIVIPWAGHGSGH